MADFDGDGRLDLYTGSFEGSVYVLFGKGAGEFAEPVKLLDKTGAALRLGLFWDSSVKPVHWAAAETAKFPEEQGISAAAVDWEGDGDLDLVLGAYHGRMYLRRNLGTAKAAAFATEDLLLEAEGAPLMAESGQAMPQVADWDGDGRWDLLSGSLHGAVRWWRNVGTKDAPKFAAPLVLVPDSTGALDTPGTRTQVSVCDFDADGRLDLLVGDYRVDQTLHRGYVWWFRRLPGS
ncbi:MAG: VCBS repeat-containing protein [Planctomycetota bacterium]